ncbi:hypothetical protein AB2M62_07430 [Sphingomonas sp. MMS12-HWE2-04]|uniref:hypothetical protein n=1 Tax=Sphingomonas sp. MMS12-HWE2-04 TaxID=3234199 RepID=UPI00384B224B
MPGANDITINGVTATWVSTGGWQVARNPSKSLPAVFITARTKTEATAVVSLLAAPPTNTRAALLSYYNDNHSVQINLTEVDDPGRGGYATWTGMKAIPGNPGVAAPVLPRAQLNDAIPDVFANVERGNYVTVLSDPKYFNEAMDININGIKELVIHELLHPFLGGHIWGTANNPTSQLVGQDPVINQTWADLNELGIIPLGYTSGTPTLQQYVNWYTLRLQRGGSNAADLWAKPIRSADSDAYIAASQIGATIGSTIGRYLFDGNIVTSTLGGSVFETIGQNIGQYLSTYGLSGKIKVGDTVVSVLDDFGSELGTNLKEAAIGAVSSALLMELGRELGISGFGAELLNTTGSTILGKVLNNLVTNPNDLFAGLNGKGLFGSVGPDGVATGGILPGAIGSFFGSKLGSLILAPNNTEGAVLSSLGASLGVVALTSGATTLGLGSIAASLSSIFGSISNFAVPFVGSLVGFLLGSLIGRLFGKKKPRIPTASADIYLNVGAGGWSLGTVTAANNGNRALVTNMASIARDSINSLIALTVNGQDIANFANPTQPRQKYGHTGSTVYYDELIGASWVRRYSGDSSNTAVELGVMSGIAATRIRGGDIIVKRALYGTPTNSFAELAGRAQVAQDYAKYLKNPAAINALIAGDPSSAFSAGWIVTLMQAEELGLSSYRPSDFFGGLAGFAESFGFGIGAKQGQVGIGYEHISLAFEGSSLRISSSDGSGAFDILSGSNNLGVSQASWQSALIADFGANVGYTLWGGEATAGNDIWIASGSGSAVTMDDTGTQWVGYWDPYWGNYYQYPITVTGGDDIFVGSSYNDVLYGRSGWDWLDGGAGYDTIDGGDNDDVLLGRGDKDRLSGGSGNDYISGGDGDDYFSDANNTWGLYGNDGNDILVGGAGMDSLYGENGDDTIIVDQDGGGVWDALGGANGQDTLSYERFTSGVYVDFSVLGGWSWDPTAKYIYGDAISGMENLTGSQYGDTILGDSIDNVIRGLGGNDSLYGRDGNDTLEGGAGGDYLSGDGGIDTASYASSSSGVLVGLADGTALGGDAKGDYFVSIENVTGSKFNDALTGDSNSNVLSGMAGDDRFYLSAGYDLLDGGDGVDTLDASGATAALSLYFDAGYYDPYYGYYTPGAGWVANVSTLGTTTFSSIESFVGTAFADWISGDNGDEVYEAGAGNDTLYGSGGSDTYIFGRGDGYDSISETIDGANGIILKDDINWRDVAISGAAYNVNYGNLVVSILGTADQIVVGGNFSYVNSGTNAGNHNHAIKSLTLGGVSTVDIDMIDWTPAGAQTDAATVVYGAQNRADLIFAYGGADVIYAAGNSTAYETRGNVIYAGDGDDTIYGSYGDDQYIFERGNGADWLSDFGGLDTIVMGPSVSADDVIYQVVVTSPGVSADLYIGLRDPNNSSLTASQVADRILVSGGGTKLVGMYYGTESYNTTEYVRVGGQEIDLTKAGINWETSYYYDGGGYFPVALDLDGDGIELRSVNGSRIASVEGDGTITRVGWLGQDDGFLALDRNGDGVIDRIGEISFIGDVEGARSDLEGLAAYDSNGDGKLDASDKRFGEFQVWQDKNQDGFGSADELVSMEQAGLRSISLKGQATGFTPADGLDNVVLATSEIEWADPTRTGTAHDVMLARLQVRTDGGDVGASGEGDPLDALLYGVQGLTEAQVEAIRQTKIAAAKDGDAGLLYRIETLLDSGAASKNGLYTLDAGTAASLSATARRHNLQDPFATSTWTLAGSVEEGERDTSGDGAAFTKQVPTDAQKAMIAEVRQKVAADKAAAAATAVGKAARDATSEEARPAPKPPTAEELARLAAKDQFRLLGTDTDPETAARLAAEAAKASNGTGPQASPTSAAPHLTALTAANEDESEEAPVTETAPSGSTGYRVAASVDQPSSGQGPQSTDSVNDSAYGVVIRTANARLVQALASFGEIPAMMTTYQGLNSANDPQAAWLTVDAMPSVQKLASIR